MNKETKEQRIKRFKSMTSQERIELILKKMEEKDIHIGSGVPFRHYENNEVRDLIRITNCFPELRSTYKEN